MGNIFIKGQDKHGANVYNIPAVVGAIVGPFVLLIAFLTFNPFYSVQSTERALLFTWGAISEEVVGQGLHMRMPIAQSVEYVSILPIEHKFQIPVGGDGAISKDNQTIGVDVTVFYKYDPNKLVDLWKNYGKEKIESLVTTAAKESVKVVIGSYTIFDIAPNQAKIQNEAITIFRNRLTSYPVEVTEMRIMNWDWSDDYDSQIRITMQRAQEVKQKEQELLISQTNAQKQVAEAEAQKKAQLIKAEAEKNASILAAEGEFESAKLMADARAQAGRGEKEYNEAIARTLEIQMKLKQLEIEMEKVKRWNGQYVPTNNYGPIPIQQGAIQGR